MTKSPADGSTTSTLLRDYDVIIGGRPTRWSTTRETNSYDLAIAAPLPGDFNADGTIDGAHLAVWNVPAPLDTRDAGAPRSTCADISRPWRGQAIDRAVALKSPGSGAAIAGRRSSFLLYSSE